MCLSPICHLSIFSQPYKAKIQNHSITQMSARVKYLKHKDYDFIKNLNDFLLKIPDSSSVVSSLFDHDS